MTGRRAATVFGLAVALVAAVDLIRWLRPFVLMDPEPGWALPRLLLGLFVVAAAAAAGGLAAAAFVSFAPLLFVPPTSIALSRRAIVFLAAAAIAAGALLRFASLERLPPSLWIDDVSLIAPALELTGSPRDFSNAIRPAPYGVAKPYGSVGVLYLELYRCALSLWKTTVFGVRFLSAAAGALSVVTAMLLARELLPAGGGALAALVMAGLRWNLIVSRWGWNAVVVAPILDLAALMLLRARRRDSLALAALAGVLAGLAAHVYLAAWIAAAALAALAFWPRAGESAFRGRWRPALLFAAGFALAAAPIFLLRQNRVASYFARAADHSLAREIGYARSMMPALASAADSLAAPWLTSDPAARNDLPGKSRLGWILGLPAAALLLRSLGRPREELSAYLLSQAAAGLAASVAGGHADVPNGYRFAYLATPAAVASAGGMLCLIALFGRARRRVASIAAIGLVAISGALGARDALARWPQRRETFDGFHGQDTLIARAAIRWERYGGVAVAPVFGHSPITI